MPTPPLSHNMLTHDLPLWLRPGTARHSELPRIPITCGAGGRNAGVLHPGHGVLEARPARMRPAAGPPAAPRQEALRWASRASAPGDGSLCASCARAGSRQPERQLPAWSPEPRCLQGHFLCPGLPLGLSLLWRKWRPPPCWGTGGAEEETQWPGAREARCLWRQEALAQVAPGPPGRGFGEEAWSSWTRVPGRLLAPVPPLCHVSILPTRRRGRRDAV